MPKKSTIISTLIALGASMAGTVGAIPASASIVKDGATYWSTSEIMDFKAEILEKIATDCTEDVDIPECTRNIHLAYFNEQRGKYMAYTAAEDELGNFAITSVNPATDTVKIFTSDHDRDMMGGSTPSKLNSFYAVWGDESASIDLGWTVSGSGAFYANDIETGTLRDDVHQLIGASHSGSANVIDIDTIVPMSEMEFIVPGGNLKNNLSGDFYFTTLRENGSDALGYRSYGNCLKSSGYELGKECRLMFSSEGYYDYLPISAEQGTGTTGETTGENTGGDTGETGKTGENEETGKNEETGDLGEKSNDNPDKTSESNENTTEQPAETNNESSNSPETQESSKTGITLSVREISTSSTGVPSSFHGTTKTVKSTKTATTSATTTGNSSSEENQTSCDGLVAAADGTVELPLSGGVTTQTGSEEEHAFPWWIIAFVFSGIVLTIWWFFPTKNYEKKSEKSLDN